MLKSLKLISRNFNISAGKSRSRAAIALSCSMYVHVHKIRSYHRAAIYTSSQANYHSQGCSSCLPLHARVCLVILPSKPRKKGIRSAAVKIFLRRMSRVYSGGLLAKFAAPTARAAPANLVSRRPARIRSFPRIWLRRPRPATQPRETSARNFARRPTGITFFPPLSKILRAGEMSTYFYRICSTARRVQRCVSICGITGMLEMSRSCVDTFERYRLATWKSV